MFPVTEKIVGAPPCASDCLHHAFCFGVSKLEYAYGAEMLVGRALDGSAARVGNGAAESVCDEGTDACLCWCRTAMIDEFAASEFRTRLPETTLTPPLNAGKRAGFTPPVKLGFAAVLKPPLSAPLPAAFVLLGKPAKPPETPFGGYGCGFSCTVPPPPGSVGAS